MKKLQIDLVSILILALLVAAAILIWGDYMASRRLKREAPHWQSLHSDRWRWRSSCRSTAGAAGLTRYARWGSGCIFESRRWRVPRRPASSPAERRKSPRRESSNRFVVTCESGFGWSWRYSRPWLLLTGDDRSIGRLIPELVESGWMVTADAVLLWSKADPDGRPDENWLRQLGKLRRRRPVDAVVLTLDGAAELPMQRRGSSPCGVNLARIADTLHWSAPVYLLDVAQADGMTNDATPGDRLRIPGWGGRRRRRGCVADLVSPAR